MLTGRGRPYLQARAALAEHPQATRPLVIEKLDALDAREAALRAGTRDPTKTEAFGEIDRDRSRLVALLAEMRDPADAGRFAAQLRSALREDRPADPWLPLLLGLGPAAVPELARLVADNELELDVRQSLLDELVSITPAEQLPALTAQLGRGQRELDRSLRRSLTRRARSSASEAAALVAALDATIADEARAADARAASVLVRATIAPEPAWLQSLAVLASDDDAPFALRVATLSVLEGRGDIAQMQALARLHLAPERRSQQRSEVLATLALRALPGDAARGLVEQFKLRKARAPRLAEIAWRLAKVEAGAKWINQALTNPWPQVRIAALQRVQGPCDPAPRRTLAARAGPRSGGGDPDAAVARAAVEALGRCGDLDALTDLLDETGIGFEQRGVVARSLIVNGGAPAMKTVAARLRPDLPPQLAERYADALGSGEASKAPDDVLAALCRTEAAVPTAAPSARRSRRKLFGERGCE